MDILKRGIDKYVEGGRLVWADLQSLGQNIGNFDPRVNAVGFLIIMAVTAFVSMFLLANFTGIGTSSSSTAAKEAAGNAALGFANSGIVRKPGDPPIPPPTEVIALRIYPIKSCRGFEIQSTRLRKAGLTLDRNWMFIDKAERKFMTIRTDSSMTLVDTKIVDDETSKEQMLEISLRGRDERVRVAAFPSQDWLKKNTTLGSVEIWEEQTDAWEYGEDVNRIFCDFFEKDVALVYKGPSARMVAVNGSKDLYGAETPHHFADVMSLLVASDASIQDLNRRLKTKTQSAMGDLAIERFRPNIIVRGEADKPWQEDTWKRIRLTTTLPHAHALYKIDLDVVARCARCQVPNVNPDTAEKHPKQPWDEMMKFRRVDKGGVAKYKPCFGMLCIPRNEGIIQVGAELEVLETTNNHLYNTSKFEDL